MSQRCCCSLGWDPWTRQPWRRAMGKWLAAAKMQLISEEEMCVLRHWDFVIATIAIQINITTIYIFFQNAYHLFSFWNKWLFGDCTIFESKLFLSKFSLIQVMFDVCKRHSLWWTCQARSASLKVLTITEEIYGDFGITTQSNYRCVNLFWTFYFYLKNNFYLSLIFDQNEHPRKAFHVSLPCVALSISQCHVLYKSVTAVK